MTRCVKRLGRAQPRFLCRFLTIFIVAVLLAACSGGSKHPELTRLPGGTPTRVAQVQQSPGDQSATPTATATDTPAPSPTPTESPTPTPTETPSPTSTPSPTPPPETLTDGTHGYVVSSGVPVYADASTSSAVVTRLRYEQQLDLLAKVRGERVVVGDQTWAMAIEDWSNVWYRIDGGFVYSAYVWIPRPGEVLPEALPAGERWVDVNIATQTARLMIGSTAVYTAPVTSGKDGYETPTGHWRVVYQVANETMTSSQAGINDPNERYDVHNVLFTQYFDSYGDALHLNYWQPESVFGNARTSHGCVGLFIRDAQYFWMFGQQGMRVEINSNGRILPPPAQPAPAVTTAPATRAPVAPTQPPPTTAPTRAPAAPLAVTPVVPPTPVPTTTHRAAVVPDVAVTPVPTPIDAGSSDAPTPAPIQTAPAGSVPRTPISSTGVSAPALRTQATATPVR